MQKLNQFWKGYKFYMMGTLLILGLVIAFSTLKSIKFYGFEYEDSFVSAHVSSQDNLKLFIKNFRTQGCETRIDGNCISVSSYTGHYITYSVYLYSVAKIFNIENNYLIHKVGNALLFSLCFLIIFIFYKDNLVSLILMFSFLACLPVAYVLNSGLIENLSFVLGVFLILSLRQFLIKTKSIWLIIFFVFLLLLIVVKRENLIYLSVLIIIGPKYLIKNIWFWVFTITLILSQYFINPFFTEGLEASYLGRSTFSFDYFRFQFPTYFMSFFRLDGFLILLIFLFVTKKPSKNSLILLTIWLAFILLYSFHYRGQYAIEAGEITHFESFRYMYNTLPLLIGYLFFGAEYNKTIKTVISFFVLTICTVLIYDNIEMLNEFGREESLEYHLINKKIELIPKKGNNLAVHDNFVLISMLNFQDKKIDLFSANKNHLEFYNEKTNILINRFNIINIEAFSEDYKFELINDLSTKGVKVYYFEKCFVENERM